MSKCPRESIQSVQRNCVLWESPKNQTQVEKEWEKIPPITEGRNQKQCINRCVTRRMNKKWWIYQIG